MTTDRPIPVMLYEALADKTYRQIYEQDHTNVAGGRIQWQGTEVCMDTGCSCGFTGHIDADFCYYVQCPRCGQKYAVGTAVKFIPLTNEQAEILGAATFVPLDSDA